LLVAPKVWSFTDPYVVTLPDGDWYDYWTGAKIAGEHSLKVDPPLGTLPVYVRAGSIIPQQPVVQNVDEAPRGPLVLRVYPGPQCQGGLYMDDGNTLAYQKGQTMRVSFTCEGSADHVNVEISGATGPYRPWFKEVQLEIYGVSGTVKSVTADGRPMTGWKSQTNVVTLPPLAWSGAAHDVKVEIGAK
jgi:alpha-glucosidase